MEHKTLPLLYKEFEDERTVASLFAVMGNMDDGGDVIFSGAFRKTLKERPDRVKVLWQHDFSGPPVGVPLEMREIARADLPSALLRAYPEATGALLGKVRYLDTPRGNEILAGIREGAITENSIGYDAVKFDFEDRKGADGLVQRVRNLREVRLWDISPVNWGMNSATRNLKGVAFADTGISREAWAEPTLAQFGVLDLSDADEAEKGRLAAHYAWREGDTFLYGHHAPRKDGVGPAVWAGVRGALARLLADGHLSAEDRKMVYNHLAEHYAQFGEEAPAWDVVALAGATSLFLAGKSGSGELRKAVVDLQGLLLAEPPDVQRALTAKRLIGQTYMRISEMMEG